MSQTVADRTTALIQISRWVSEGWGCTPKTTRFQGIRIPNHGKYRLLWWQL